MCCLSAFWSRSNTRADKIKNCSVAPLGGCRDRCTAMWMDSRAYLSRQRIERYMIYLWSAATLIQSLMPSCRPAQLRRCRNTPPCHMTRPQTPGSWLLTTVAMRHVCRTEEGESLQLRAGLKQKPWQAAWRLRFIQLGLSNRHPLWCWSSGKDFLFTTIATTATNTSTATTAAATGAATTASTTTSAATALLLLLLKHQLLQLLLLLHCYSYSHCHCQFVNTFTIWHGYYSVSQFEHKNCVLRSQ